VKTQDREKYSVGFETPKQMGRDFFSRPFDKPSTERFLNYFLFNGDYEGLFTAMRFGYVRKNHGSKNYITNSLGLHDLDSGYFHLFLDLAGFAKTDVSEIFKVAIASFNAPEDNILYAWRPAARGNILDAAEKNFDATVKMLDRYDPTYKSFAILFEVNKSAASEFLVTQLLYGKDIDKTAIRKLLMQFKIDVNYIFGPHYKDNDSKTREAIVRLALLYKSDNFVAEFLERVLEIENNQAIKDIIIASGDRGKVKPPLNILEEFEFSLMTGKTTKVTDFLTRLKVDKPFANIAEQVFFSIYENDYLTNIVVVHEGSVRDLDNQPMPLASNQRVGVLHPIEIPPAQAFIKNLEIPKQPILQIARPHFLPTDHEYSANKILKFDGTLLASENFATTLKQHGFKIVYEADSLIVSQAAIFLGDYACVIHFTNDTTMTKLKHANFYMGKDFVPLKGKLFFERAVPISISQIPARSFSEFMFALTKVGGACLQN